VLSEVPEKLSKRFRFTEGMKPLWAWVSAMSLSTSELVAWARFSSKVRR